ADGHAHLLADAQPPHPTAAPAGARSRPNAGVARLALLYRFVRRVAGTAHGGDAEGEPRAPLRFAVVRLQMRMELDESGHDGQSGRVDDLHPVVSRRAVRLDASDRVAFAEDVDVGARRR